MIAALKPEFWWYVARSSGIVAWALLALSMAWGLMVASRMIPLKKGPRWLLDMHRFLGGLSLAFVALHIGALVADNYLHFGWREIFVPFASAYEPGAVAWGVVALYLLVVVEVTSLAMRHIPRRWWRIVHWSSFALFVAATVHTFIAGTDSRNLFMVVMMSMLLGVIVFAIVYRSVTAGRVEPRTPRVTRRTADQ